MKVSVIIPVFNAEPFVEKAIQSALQLSECAELIIVDDGSTDGSLEKCRQIGTQDPRIILIEHKSNLGASQARNTALKIASQPFISFLDADDYYLEKRFAKTKEIFQKNQEIDGVYESVGTHYYDEVSKQKHIQRLGRETTALYGNPPSDQLFASLLKAIKGHIHLDGLTLTKNSLQGFSFDPDLVQTQDTDFIWSLALNKNLLSGDPEQLVAKRGVHTKNRVFNEIEHDQQRKYLYIKWLQVLRHKPISKGTFLTFIRNYVNIIWDQPKDKIKLVKLTRYLSLIFRNPWIIYKFF